MTDVDDHYEPYDDDAVSRAEEPPDWVLEQEAADADARHRRDVHGGGECGCPVAEPEYSDEAPF